MPEQQENTQPRQDTEDYDEVGFLDLLIVLARQKKLVLGLPVFGGAMAMIVSILMTPMYTSTAKIMPPQQQSSGAAALLGQLGGLAGAMGGVAGLKNPGDLYVGMLQSRTVADNLIKRFNLQEHYETTLIDDTRKLLAGASQIGSGKKDGLISISITDEDPKFAAELANAYVDELMKLTQTMAITEASQRRLFFERQLKEAKENLANAEIAWRSTQERTGMIQPEGQVQALIGSIAQLRGTIAAKEVQLNAMRTFATARNPELMKTQEELRGLKAQLQKMERDRPVKDGDFMVPTEKIPEVGVEIVRRLRDVKYYETMFELLAKQYELARIDEARDSSMIQLLDKAVPPKRKAKPKRAFITIVGFLVGAFLGTLCAFAFESYRRSRVNPAKFSRWQELYAAWKN